MKLVMDIGNSSTKVGLWDGREIVRAERFESPVDGLEHMFDDVKVTSAGAVSVVPGKNAPWIDFVRLTLGLELRFFDHLSAWPVQVDYATPETLGNDRVAAAVAGFLDPQRLAGMGAVVIDAGTAVTFEIVTSDGVYPGGIIAPGPELLRQSLKIGTAQLPLVPLEMPTRVTGRSTVEAMQSGIMYGFRETVSGLLENIRRDHGPAFVVATGGWAVWLSDRISDIHVVRPHLVLRGVAEMLDINDGSKESY